MNSVSWCLGQAPPPAPTCPPAPDSGAQHLEERGRDVRPSTCPGQMELPVVRTSGASGPSVSADMIIKTGAGKMEAGESGGVGPPAPGLVVEVSRGQ